MSHFSMDRNELAYSLTRATLGCKSYFVVGTGYSYPTEDEPTKGRILIFTVSENSRRSHLEATLDISGCCYSIESIDGNLVAAVNSKVLMAS